MVFKNISINKGIYILITGIFFYIILLFMSDIDKIFVLLNQIPFDRYAAILLLSVLTLLIYGWRHQVLLNKLGINLNYKDCFLIHTAGIAMIITPGGVGSVIRSYILKRKTGYSISSTTPILIYERWLDIVCLTSIIGILLYWNNIIESQIVFCISLFLSITIFLIFKNSLGLSIFNKILIKTKILKKFTINAKEFKESTQKLILPKNTIQLLLISFLTKLVPLTAVYLVFDLFNLNIDIFNTSQIYFTSQIIGLLSFVPGGIIITEGGMLGLLLKNGIDFTTASLLIFLIRILTFWFPLFIGFITLKFMLSKN